MVNESVISLLNRPAMTDQNLFRNGDVSFWELVKYFSKFKRMIAACAMVGSFVGVGWYTASPARYIVEAPFFVKIYPTPIRDLCESVSAGGSLSKFLDCLDQQVAGQLQTLSTENWKSGQSVLTQETSKPKLADAYEADLREIENKYNASIKRFQQSDLEIIADIDDRISATETVGSALLSAQRNLKILADGDMAIYFRPIVINEITKNFLVITIVSTILGAMAGMTASLVSGFVSKDPARGTADTDIGRE